MWNWASIHSKRKDIRLVQMSKMWKEMDFIRKDGSNEAAGGQIRASLEHLYATASAGRAAEHMEDITYLMTSARHDG